MRARPSQRPRAGSALAALFVVMATLGLGETAGGQTAKQLVRVALPMDMFDDVSRKDAEVALATWAQEVLRTAKRPMEARTAILDDGEAIAAATQRGELDLFGMTSLDYLRFREKLAADAALLGDRGQGPADEHLLIVRRDSGLAAVRDLGGKRLLLQSGTLGVLSRMWLDTLLLGQHLPETSRFFEARAVAKPTQAVLPVFFRQADAGIVTGAAYATLQELNPQLSRDLTILSHSPKLTFSLFLFGKQADTELRDLVSETAFRFPTTAMGKQVLLLFKLRRILPYNPSALEGVSGLARDHAAQRAGRRP